LWEVSLPAPPSDREQLSLTRELQTLPPEVLKRRRISVAAAAALKGISTDSFRRHYAHLIEQASPRRQVVELAKVID
jgi:hypothetical protein